MTIDELKAAIERRGYRTRIVREVAHPDCAEIIITSKANYMGYGFTLQHLEQVKTSISDHVEHTSKGQHHCQHECGYPLLRETKNTRGHETLAYRSAWEGPQSKIVVECPKCEQYVQDDSVIEI